MKVIVNNVRSCHNVGSIFRTADALGVTEILLCGYTPSPIDKYGLPCKPLVKVSLGAENSVKWKKFASIGGAIKYCQKDEMKIIALEIGDNAVVYTDKSLNKISSKKIALVLGNERRGLSRATLSKVDKIVYIPMKGLKESLNVSIAFAIVASRLI